MTAIKLTPERSLTINHRVGRAASFKFVFTKDDGSAYDISALDFELFLKKLGSTNTSKIIPLTIGNGLEITGADSNELSVTITEENALLLEPTRYHWQLVELTSVKTWFNGPFIVHTLNFDAGNPEDVQVTVNVSDVVVQVSITLFDVDDSELLDTLEVDTSGGTISLDFDGSKERIFVGDAAFTGAKILALLNTSIAKVFSLHINVTTSCTLTVPSSFEMDNTDNRWNTGTQVLTLTGSGHYEITGTFDSVLGVWKVKATPDGGTV